MAQGLCNALIMRFDMDIVSIVVAVLQRGRRAGCVFAVPPQASI